VARIGTGTTSVTFFFIYRDNSSFHFDNPFYRFLLLMNGYTIFIAQPLLRFCDDFIIIIQTSMFEQSKNNIKNLL